MSTTLKDIARKARVSYQTVSHALNSTGRVSEETLNEIRLVAKEMNYIPHGIARSLRIQNTMTLGIIFPCIYENEFYAGIYRSIEDVLLKAKYNVILCNSDFDVEREATYLRLLHEKRVDGIVIAPAIGKSQHYENAELIGMLIQKFKLPVILVDRYIEGFDTHYVGCDNVSGAYEAVEHLIKLGHRKIGCVLGPRISSVQERFKGYQKALEGYRMEFDGNLVRWFEHFSKFEHSNSKSGAYYCTKDLLKTNRPTAIFVVNDTEAIGVMKAINEMGLKVPEDIAIVGFDDSKIAAHLSVPLTTVKQDLRKIGESVAKIFLEEVNKVSVNGTKRIIVPCHLIIRKSSGAKLDNT